MNSRTRWSRWPTAALAAGALLTGTVIGPAVVQAATATGHVGDGRADDMGITAQPRRMLSRAGVTGLVLSGIPAGSAAAAPSVATVAPGARPSVPHPGTSSFLKGLACPSLHSCWAVGFYSSGGVAEFNQALHWNGTRWSTASVPSPGDASPNGSSNLYSVACVAPASCWAVGWYSNRDEADVNQALHWNGTRWSKASIPSPGGTASGDASVLNGVRCTSPVSCWAVGDYASRTQPGPTLNQALHWNGRTWRLAGTPDPAGTDAAAFNTLNGVTCASAASCWAVGFDFNGIGTTLNQTLQWNGRKWSRAAVPEPGGTITGDFSALYGVTCASSADCWAAGYYDNASVAIVSQALHWGGRKWSLVGTPDPDGTGEGADNRLRSVACVSPADCWAVGSYGMVSSGTGVRLNLALHWNGRKWSLIATPDPAGATNGDMNELWSVRCSSRASCQAVGDSQANGGRALNQALHWGGTKWSTR